jgi:hypothetical protein
MEAILSDSNQIFALTRIDPEGVERVLHGLEWVMTAARNKVVTMSSALSGIQTPETAAHILAANVKAMLKLTGDDQLIFDPLFAIEWDTNCVAEILASPVSPRCIFSDQLTVLPPSTLDALAHFDVGDPDSVR